MVCTYTVPREACLAERSLFFFKAQPLFFSPVSSAWYVSVFLTCPHRVIYAQICKSFEIISRKALAEPEDSKEMMELIDYMTTVCVRCVVHF